MRLYISSLLLLLAVAAHAQRSQHYGIFPTIDHSGTLTDRLGYSLYYFGGANLLNKRDDGIKEPSELFVFYSEQALTYKLGKGFSLAGSYVYERQHPMGDNYRDEHRFYLQGAYSYNLGNTTLRHRLRFDGRFIGDRITGDYPYTHRLRYLFGLSAPLQGKQGRWYLNAYNEFFFNTHSSLPVLYAEDWAYAGVGYKTRKAGNFEVGPLYMFWVNSGGRRDLTNFYYLQLTWATHIDFTHRDAGVQPENKHQ